MKDIIDCLPFNLQDHENIPVTTYKLTATIRNKVFNCKETVEPIELDEQLSINDDIYPCNCEDPEFCEPDHGYVITGDLRLIKNQKLRKLFTMGPTFREPKSQIVLDWAFEEFAGSLILKHKLEDTAMDLWENKAKEKVNNKIKFL